MNLQAGVSLGQLLLALGVMLVTSGVAWGSLLQRVKVLEKEVDALSTIPERLTRIEEQTKFANQELGKLTSSWLFKEPPGYSIGDHQAPTPRRRRTTGG